MKKIFLFLVLLFAVGSSVFLWASPGFRAFFLGAPAELHPVVIQNSLYIPLSEAARLFHLKADVDMSKKLIVLEPDSSSQAAAAPASSQAQDEVILGKIETALNKTVEKPLLNIKIYLFKANDRYDEDENRHALALWILKNDPFYSDTHGKVADTMSDPDGHFAFSKIPPGNYELVATHPLSPREIGYWWIPLQLTKGQVKEVTLNSGNVSRLSVGTLP